MFIGRHQEIEALRSVLQRTPALAIIYGRRRVGKSALIHEALKDRPHAYFQATRLTDTDSQANFKDQLSRQLELSPTFMGLWGWEHLLGALLEHATAAPGFTLVLDEFPYLCEANPALPSIVQKISDAMTRERAPFNLILCGSRIAFMSELLEERNPLYGRQSAVMDIKPLPFREATRFFEGWKPEDRVRGYAVFGGMPYYLTLVDPAESLAQNIQRLFLAAQAAPLREEPQHLLEAELQNVGRYASILRAVAGGATKRNEIVNRIFGSSPESDSISEYFKRLNALRLLTQEVSMEAQGTDKRANVRYRVTDPFLSFHYRFVTPNLTTLETAPAAEVYDALIAPFLDEYTSGPFEEMAREYVRRHGREILPSSARHIGKIWARDYDLDVAGELLDGSAVFGEVKWSVKHLGLNQIHELQSRLAHTLYLQDAAQKYLLFFSRSGFSPQLQAVASADPQLRLISVEDMMGADSS